MEISNHMNTAKVQSESMRWLRKKSTLHVAEGKKGIFYIEESRRGGRRLFWVKYRSKEENGKNFNMPPSSTLALAKLAAEENQYWEDGASDNVEQTEPQHSITPRANIIRWDMKY